MLHNLLFGSGELFGKMLLVKLLESIILMLILGQVISNPNLDLM